MNASMTNKNIALENFDFSQAGERQAAAEIWKAACGADLAFSPDFIAKNTRPVRSLTQEGRLAIWQGKPAGFVIASAVNDEAGMKLGWIDAIAVAPWAQRRGAGRLLLGWAEGWLGKHGCQHARLGGSLRPFTHGLPVEIVSEAAFARLGYPHRSGQEYEWDVARSLQDYQPVIPVPPEGAKLAPMQPGQEGNLLNFMAQEFPGRWRFEVELFLADGGRASDFLLLWKGNEVVGFSRVTLEDSERSIERFYMHRLAKPWGQFGPLGVGQSVRGMGLGGYLIDASAQHLHKLGVDGCVIDWTGLLELYGKFGFKPFRKYLTLVKPLGS